MASNLPSYSQGIVVEASRRVVRALEASERSATELGQRIWWLNLWLLVFTIVICGLTIVLVLGELDVMRRPHP
jgi:ABC-type Fe3+-siderophore transport system permease subunit